MGVRVRMCARVRVDIAYTVFNWRCVSASATEFSAAAAAADADAVLRVCVSV